MKTIAITIDDNLLRRIDSFVAGSGTIRRTRSQIIRQAVQEYLDRLECLIEEEREREIFQQQRQRLAREAAALIKEQAKL